MRSIKFRSSEISSKFLQDPESLNFGYSPENSVTEKQKLFLPRKVSLLELRQIEQNKSQLLRTKIIERLRKPTINDSFSSKKAIEIVKEAQQELQKEIQEKKKIPLRKGQRTLTLESQTEAMNFTFAQNFSNKQIIMKEFSSQCLRKKFFI